jgi:hypothetical protein
MIWPRSCLTFAKLWSGIPLATLSSPGTATRSSFGFNNYKIDWIRLSGKASAAALACKASNVVGVVAEVSADGIYHRAQSFVVHIPTVCTKENLHIYEDAARMTQPTRTVNLRIL